ncbi:MAG TPA: hypothetical protein VFM55_24845 [Micromonosporaceae bacterium]|nr:hypothetical protein [Micromonosporaceae bacterium]
MFGDALAARIGARFLFVTVIPNLFFVGVVATMLAAGAPQNRPSWIAVTRAIHDFSFKWLLLLSAALVIVSLATHPLQLPLIQIVEGYWAALPGGDGWEQVGRRRYTRQLAHLRAVRQNTPAGDRRRAEAERRLRWMPVQPRNVKPTELGNTLYAGEVRAGRRYSLNTDIAWPRLRPLIPDRMRGQVNDARNQLDAAVRYCVLSLLAAVICVPMLIRYDIWLMVPLVLYLLAWGSYRAAVAAAKRFCQELAVAFDLHHLQLWDALSLERPKHLGDERERNKALCELLAGERDLDNETYESFTYTTQRSQETI